MASVQVDDSIAYPCHLFVVRVVEGDDNLAWTSAHCSGSQGFYPGMHRAQRARDIVGQGEDARGGAPIVDEWIAPSRSRAVRPGEVVREVIDVGHARPAPLVDGLAGIAHGRDRVALGEHLLQEHSLRGRGVLVFVEKHEAIALAEFVADVGCHADNGEREAHLVGEVDAVLSELGFAELLNEAAQRCAQARRGEHVPADRLQTRQRLQPVDEVRGVGQESFGLEIELRECIVECEDSLDQGHRGAAEVRQRQRRRPHDARREDLTSTIGQDDRVGLETQAYAVIAQQATGEGVVRRDRGLDRAGVGKALGEQALAVGAQEETACAREQLSGGLGGEGEAEHLIRKCKALHHEPQHPRRHDRGLARARSGDDC